MRYLVKCAALVFLVCAISQAQERTAESGYYPACFNGSTWTGVVSKTDDATREVTLTYTDKKRDQTETFVGVLAEGYQVRAPDGETKPLLPSNLRTGGQFTVYYCDASKKVEGKKVKYKNIFLIKGYPDLSAHYTFFRAF